MDLKTGDKVRVRFWDHESHLEDEETCEVRDTQTSFGKLEVRVYWTAESKFWWVSADSNYDCFSKHAKYGHVICKNVKRFE